MTTSSTRMPLCKLGTCLVELSPKNVNRPLTMLHDTLSTSEGEK